MNGRFNIVELPVNYDGNNYSNVSNGTSIKMHLDREPRFYANIDFHHGFYEITQYDGEITSDDPAKRVIVEELRNMTVMVSEIKTFIILLPDIITKNWCILRMKMAWCTIRYLFSVWLKCI